MNISLNLSVLVGSSGLEPPTSRLSGARSNHLSYEPISYLSVYLVLSPRFSPLRFPSPSGVGLTVSATAMRVWVPDFPAGGDDGIRTHDPLLAGQVLSQLSYTPIFLGFLFFEFPSWSLKIEQQAICTRIVPYLTSRLS